MRNDDRFNYGIQRDTPPPRRAHDRRMMWMVARGVALGVFLAMVVLLLLGLMGWAVADAVVGPPACHNAPCSESLR